MSIFYCFSFFLFNLQITDSFLIIILFRWVFEERFQLTFRPGSISRNSSPRKRNSNQSNVLPYYCFLVRLRENPLWRPETISFKRLFLLILGIYALSLSLQNEPEFDNFVKCLDIFLKTISEPYLTVIEIRSLLIIQFRRRGKEYLLDELCEVFKNAVPFCTRNFEPRRLCHLARCQVRQNLCNSGSSSTLPAVLDQMKMPKQVKEFLLCEPSEKNVFQNNF